MLATRFILFLAILAVVCSLAYAMDPDPLQDFCVGVNDSKASVFVNGKICKDPELVTTDDFFYSGLNRVGDTSNRFGSHLTQAFETQLPGLNHQGLAMVRIDFALKGLNPPHEHPRAAEIIVVMEGTIYAGFIASNPQNPNTRNKLYAKNLYPGDVFIFPKGTLHFQYNVGKTNALAFAFFNSQNPGVVTPANSLFGSEPSVYPKILAKAFQMDQEDVEYLQSLNWDRNN